MDSSRSVPRNGNAFTRTTVTEDAMKLDEQKRREVIRRASATYEALGVEGLKTLRRGEVLALLADKQLEMGITSRLLRQYPHDEVSQLRKEKLGLDVAELAGFMKGQDKDMEME